MKQQSRSEIQLKYEQTQEEKLVQHPVQNSNLLKTATFFDPFQQPISNQHTNQEKANNQQSEYSKQEQNTQQHKKLKTQQQSFETRDNSPCYQLSFRARYKSLDILKTEGASSLRLDNHDSPIMSRQSSFALGLLNSPQSQNTLKFMNRKSSFISSKTNPNSDKNEEFQEIFNPNTAEDIDFWKKVNSIITTSEGSRQQINKNMVISNQDHNSLNHTKQKQQLLPAIPQRTKQHYQTDIIPFKKNLLISSSAYLDSSSCSTSESCRHQNQSDIIAKHIHFQKPLSQGSYLGVVSPSSDSRIFSYSLKWKSNQNDLDAELIRIPQILYSSKSSQRRFSQNNSFQDCSLNKSSLIQSEKQEIIETSQTEKAQSPSNIQSYYPQINNQQQQYQIKSKRRASFVETINQSLIQCLTPTNKGQNGLKHEVKDDQTFNNLSENSQSIRFKRNHQFARQNHQQSNLHTEQFSDIYPQRKSSKEIKNKANNWSTCLKETGKLDTKDDQSLNEIPDEKQDYLQFLKCNEKMSANIYPNKRQLKEYQGFEFDNTRLTHLEERQQNDEFSFSVESQQGYLKDKALNARNINYQCSKKGNYLSKQQDSVVKKLFKIEERQINKGLCNNSSIIDSQQKQRLLFFKQGQHAQSHKQLFQQNLMNEQ